MADYTQPLLPLAPLIPVRDGTQEARLLYNRHYSARRYRDGRKPLKLMGPGQYLLLTDPSWTCLIGFRRSGRAIAGCRGIYLAVFRNESSRKASQILRQACQMAFARWPHESDIFTFVNPRKIKSAVPGYCFLRAGFRKTGTTKNGLLILTLRRKG